MKKEDELIQSKLNSFRPAFQMQDWDAMEKLLDTKKDRKPIVIWWKYGLAIGLFSMLAMAGIAIAVKTNASSKSLPVANDKINTTAPINTTNSATTTSSNTTNSATLNNSNTSLYNQQNTATKHSSNKASNAFYHTKNNTSSTHTASRKERRMKQELLNSPIENQTILYTDNVSGYIKRNAEYIAFYQQAITSIETNPLASNQMNKIESFIKNKKSTSIPISYSIGIQGSGLVNFSLNKNIVDLYLDQFSDAHILAQMNIGKHIGAYMGIGYADRKTINHHYTTDAFTDLTYTSFRVLNNKSIGISIPVGVSANIYQQAYFNVYAKAGINNIIFLKQVSKVEFTNSTAPISTASETKQVGNALINSSSDLMALNSIYTQNTSAALVTNNDTYVKRFTKKSDEKYLAEMNLALGLKTNMTKNIAFVFEPSYRLGFKNKYRTEYTHAIGLSGAFVLTF